MILVCKYKEAASGQWTHKEGSYFFFHWLKQEVTKECIGSVFEFCSPVIRDRSLKTKCICLLFVVKDVACLFDSKPLNIDLVLNASV